MLLISWCLVVNFANILRISMTGIEMIVGNRQTNLNEDAGR